jgi:negative regulator of sigma-B (phosphoserine phosphatase)
MTKEPPSRHEVLDWGWAGSALEVESGDLHVVTSFVGGALVALIDGLGHGPEAAQAAGAAGAILQEHATDSLLALVERCHQGLKKTRGVVMSLASFDATAGSLTWIGVGNVDGVLLRAKSTPEFSDEAIHVRGGVVGYQIPLLRASVVPIFVGDTLVMVTDGIRSAFMEAVSVEADPKEIAASILARYAKSTDDAHVVVARYLGGVP